MQKGINKVILIGNLGGDPEVRYTPGGKAVVSLSVATSESWKDRQSGQQQERTEWHRVVIFGKLAEIAAQHLKKGSKVYLEGKLQTRKWQDQQGQDRYTTEVVIKDFGGQMQMLDSKPSHQPPHPAAAQGQTPTQQSAQPPADRNPNPGGLPPAGGFDDFDDDIPF